MLPDVVDFQEIKKQVRQVRHYTVADLGGGVRGVHLHPPLAASNVFLLT